MRRLYRLLRRRWIALQPRERVVIRSLREEDIPELWVAERREEARGWLAQQTRGELHVMVAEVGGVPVGHQCLNLVWEADPTAVYCFAFHVLQQWQSRGIGTLMDLRSKSEAQARGFHALQAAIDKKNIRGLAWRERLGYRTIDEGIVRWQEPDGEHAPDCWIIERRWGDEDSRMSRFLARREDRLAVRKILRRRLSRAVRGGGDS